MLSVLFLGFVIGLQHALEADHVAAVSSLVCGKSEVKGIARHGAIWGLGHTLVLVMFGGGVLFLEMTIDDAFANGLEFGVGIMLVALGGNVLTRLWRQKIHFHAHRHGSGDLHFHAHSHRGDPDPHDLSSHAHGHPGWPRTFVVGLMHGMAGTAALVVLTATTFETPGLGFVFILVFGAGSIIGMVALSAVIAVPISLTARSLTRVNTGIQAAVGLATLAIGVVVIGKTFPAILGA